jgi:hypothetical protein
MRLILDDIPVLFLLCGCERHASRYFFTGYMHTLGHNLERLFCLYQTVRYEHLVEIVARRKSILVEDTDRTELISCY